MNSLPLGTGCPLSRRVDVRGDMGWGVREACTILSAEVCCARRSWPGLIRLPFKAAFVAAVYGAAGAHETPDNRIAPLACGDKRGSAFWAFENLGLFLLWRGRHGYCRLDGSLRRLHGLSRRGCTWSPNRRPARRAKTNTVRKHCPACGAKVLVLSARVCVLSALHFRRGEDSRSGRMRKLCPKPCRRIRGR